MLTFVTFLWTPPPRYRSQFHGRHVDILRRMVRRHYDGEHRFVCITDSPHFISEPDIELRQLWSDFSWLANPSGRQNPSCYRRMRLFARNVGDWLGDRFVVLDLDAVICGPIRPLFEGGEDFKIWKSFTSGNPYNGSMWMLRAGARPQVWEDFDPATSPLETHRAMLYGSDQAWIAHKLGPTEATWSAGDGVLSWRNDIAPRSGRLPTGARIVFFHGKVDPWSPEAQRQPWVRENYR